MPTISSPTSTSNHVTCSVLGDRDALAVLVETPNPLASPERQACDQEQWAAGFEACVDLHSERGLESRDLLRRLMAGHDLVHRRQVDRILAARG